MMFTLAPFVNCVDPPTADNVRAEPSDWLTVPARFTVPPLNPSVLALMTLPADWFTVPPSVTPVAEVIEPSIVACVPDIAKEFEVITPVEFNVKIVFVNARDFAAFIFPSTMKLESETVNAALCPLTSISPATLKEIPLPIENMRPV